MKTKYNAVSLVIDTVAVYRLTKLITDDLITEDLRNLVYNHTQPSSKLRYLITCGWCSSFWAAVAIVSLRRISPDAANIISTALALSAVTGVAYDRGL